MRRLCWLIALGGCGGFADEPDLSEANSTEAAASTGPAGTTSDSTAADSSSGDDDEGPAEGGGWCSGVLEPVAHCPPDGGGVVFECDPAKEDCPVGEKCMAWANDGGLAWNATRCVPVVDDPDLVGDPCTVEGSAVSGHDTCGLGSMCWGVDPTTLTGRCVPQCTGEAALCDDPDDRCVIANDGALHLCLASCDPLGDGCGDDETCIASLDGDWVCAPTLTVPSAPGESCLYMNACTAGSVCASPTPDCERGAAFCCTAVCDVSSPVCAGVDETCHPVNAMKGAPAGLESVGLCAVEAPSPDWLEQHFGFISDAGGDMR